MLNSILLNVCLTLSGTLALTVPRPFTERGIDPSDYGITSRQMREHLFPRAGISADDVISCDGGETITTESGIIIGCSFHAEHDDFVKALSILANGTSPTQPTLATRALDSRAADEKSSSRLSKRYWSSFLGNCHLSGVWAKQSELILANRRMAPGYGKYGGQTLAKGYREYNTLWRNVNGHDIKDSHGNKIQVDYHFAVPALEVQRCGKIPSSWNTEFVLQQLNRIAEITCRGLNQDSRGGSLVLVENDCYLSFGLDPNSR